MTGGIEGERDYRLAAGKDKGDETRGERESPYLESGPLGLRWDVAKNHCMDLKVFDAAKFLLTFAWVDSSRAQNAVDSFLCLSVESDVRTIKRLGALLSAELVHFQGIVFPLSWSCLFLSTLLNT